MKKILGLDLGTNSVGSALLHQNLENGTISEILHAGSRIVPMGDEKTAFEQGQKISKNELRRQKRGSRRLNQRYKQRRYNLINALKVMGILNADFKPTRDYLDNNLLGKTLTDEQIYALRAKAAYEPVSAAEFGRILYHLNQRRGYQPTRKERAKTAGAEKTEVVEYNTNSIIVRVSKTGETRKFGKTTKEELEIELATGLIGHSYNDSLLGLVGKEIELAVKEITNKKGEKSVSITLPNPSEWEKKLWSMEADLNRSEKTPGEYLYGKILEFRNRNEDYRIRQNLIFRHRYKEEFDKIWDVQEKHITQLNDEEIKRLVIETVMPEQSPEKSGWLKRPLKEFIKDYIIYYQRPLKSQKGSIGECSFEHYEVTNGKNEKVWVGKKVIPLSHPLYQDFRVWQAINNIKVETEDGPSNFLESDKKVELYGELSKRESWTKDDVAKFLKIGKDTLRLPESIPGNSTRHILNKACKKVGKDLKAIAPDDSTIELLWHILYSLEGENEAEKGLMKKFSTAFSTFEEAKAFADIAYFEKDWGSLSARAIKRMLPLMKCGIYFNPKEIHADIKNRLDKLINGEEEEVLTPIVRETLVQYKTIEEFNGLPYWVASSLVYGSHKAISEGEPFSNPSEIDVDKLIPLHSMRNPVVEQIVKETMQLVKDIWAQHGRPDEIWIELPREMKQNAQQRQKTYKANQDREKERKEAIQSIKANPDFGISHPSSKDIERYLLWKEAKEYCIYSGKNIPASALYNGETDIDHIMPRQRFFDDSFQNKVLVFRSENEKKDNATAYEYMQGKGADAFDKFESDVNGRFFRKKKFFLLTKEIPKDFTNRQLAESRYITRKVKELLERICPDKVFVTSGTITDYLKNQWGLNEVFKQVLRARFERLEMLSGIKLIEDRVQNNRKILMMEGFDKRIDHRHHALDAIVIAATKQGYITQLNTLSQIYEKGQLKEQSPRQFRLPSPNFREMVKDSLEEMVVSIKSRKRLLTKKKNWYYKRDEKGDLEKVFQTQGNTFSIRGKLHDEQPYGVVKQFVKIKTEKAFDAVDTIAVDWQRKTIEERIAHYGGDVSLAKKSLKKEPLANRKGEVMSDVVIYIKRYCMTYDLSPNFPIDYLVDKQATGIIDRGIRRDLLNHLKKFLKSDTDSITKEIIENAFNQDNLLLLNLGRRKPIKKVRVLVDNTQLKPMKTKNDPNEKKYVEKKKDKDYKVVIHDAVDGNRTIENIEFFDAVQWAKSGEIIDFSKPGYSHFILGKGELVFVLPIEDNNGSQVNWNNKKEISKRLFTYKFRSNNQFYFLPHNYSIALKEYKEYGAVSETEFLTEENGERTKIIKRCIKVHIDRLGNVKPALQ